MAGSKPQICLLGPTIKWNHKLHLRDGRSHCDINCWLVSYYEALSCHHLGVLRRLDLTEKPRDTTGSLVNILQLYRIIPLFYSLL